MKLYKLLTILSVMFFWLLGCAPSPHQAEHIHSTASANEPERITINQVLGRLTRGEPVIFLDSRNEVDWGLADTKIPGAIRVGNNEQLSQRLVELPKDQYIVPYCT